MTWRESSVRPYVPGNELTALPADIGKCTNMRVIDVHGRVPDNRCFCCQLLNLSIV